MLPLLTDFVEGLSLDVIGKGLQSDDNTVDNNLLVQVNAFIRTHEVEETGEFLREGMANMKKIV